MRILLATDGSQFSEAAASFLTRLDWTQQDSITAFHAVYAVPFPEDRKFHAETLATIKKEIAPRILDAAAEILKPVRAALSVEIGESPPNECTPDECILQAAAASRADLIVMGARGVRGMASAFVGSVARLVTAHAPVPVLVVKRTPHRKAGAVRVLGAVDGSSHSAAALNLLSAIPFPDDADVTLVNVIDAAFSDIPERFVMEIDDRMKETVAASREHEFAASEKILEEARSSFGRKFHAVTTLSRVGHPSTEIANAAGALDADLIAMGCRGLRGFRRVLSSVTRNVLAQAPSSVLLARTAHS